MNEYNSDQRGDRGIDHYEKKCKCRRKERVMRNMIGNLLIISVCNRLVVLYVTN